MSTPTPERQSLSPEDRRTLTSLILEAKDHPDDDAPRLILADWLDDHGDSTRAALIRAQCTRNTLAPNHPDYANLEYQETQLLLDHRSAWCAWIDWELDKLKAPKDRDLDLTRGMVRLNTHPKTLEQLAKRVPEEEWTWVDGVSLFDVSEPDFRGFCGSPVAGHLNYLYVSSSHENLSLEPFAESTRFSHLHELDFHGVALTQESLGKLLTSDSFPRLSRVCLSYCPAATRDLAKTIGDNLPSRIHTLNLRAMRLGDAAFARLLASDRLANLHRLELVDVDLMMGAVRVLSKSPASQNLRALDLSSHSWRLKSATAASIAKSENWRNLADLNLSYNSLENLGLSHLARSKNLPNLARLHLSSNDIEAEGIRSLRNSPLAETLADIQLYANRMGNAGLEELARIPFQRMTHLDLSVNQANEDGIRALGQAPWLGNLAFLELWENKVGTEGMRALEKGLSTNIRELDLHDCAIDTGAIDILANSATFSRLIELDLRDNSLNNGDLASLLRSSQLGELRAIYLDENRIGVRGAVALAESTTLGKLKRVHISGNKIGDKGRDALIERFGADNVHY